MSGRWFSILAGDEPYYDDGSFYEIARTDTYEVENSPVEGAPRTDAHRGWTRRDNADEVEGNAHLIEAAPDLYAALAKFDLHPSLSRGGFTTVHIHDDARDAIFAALAKARGEVQA